MYNDANSMAPCHHLAGPSSGAGVKPGNQALAVSVTIPCQSSITRGAEESKGKKVCNKRCVLGLQEHIALQGYLHSEQLCKYPWWLIMNP